MQRIMEMRYEVFNDLHGNTTDRCQFAGGECAKVNHKCRTSNCRFPHPFEVLIMNLRSLQWNFGIPSKMRYFFRHCIPVVSRT